MDKVNLAAAFARITEHWRPRVVAELNGQEVKLAKFRGELYGTTTPTLTSHRDGAPVEFRARRRLRPASCRPRGADHRRATRRRGADRLAARVTL
jgi:hypothetical protein